MNNADAVSALAAIAQEHRLAIYRLLVQAGPDGMAAGAIGDKLSIPASSLSFHLAHLNRTRMIVQQREGRCLIYSADFDRMNALVGFLTENCCGGRAEVCAPLLETAGCDPPKRKKEHAHEAPSRPRRR